MKDKKIIATISTKKGGMSMIALNMIEARQKAFVNMNKCPKCKGKLIKTPCLCGVDNWICIKCGFHEIAKVFGK